MSKESVRQIKAAICSIEMALKCYKKEVRASGHNITWQESRQGKGLKQWATDLCISRAQHRGKLHAPSRWNREDQQSIMDRVEAELAQKAVQVQVA